MSQKSMLKICCLFLVLALIFTVGCSANNNNQEEIPAGNEQSSNAQKPDTKSTEPVMGGTLRMINSTGPKVLGYYPENDVTSFSATMPAVETLMAVSSDRSLEPLLAERCVEDPVANTITFHLRKGVKFHDGSDLTAEVVKWNFKVAEEAQKLQYRHLIEDIEVVDEHTLVFHLSEWNNQMVASWAAVPIFSQEAFEKNGVDWVRNNPVGTGPFILEEFQRDVILTWVRNDNYWGGTPYLERIEVTYIPESVTAKAMMVAGEADMWMSPTMLDLVELEEAGFTRISGWGGIQWHLLPNADDPNSIWSNKKLREAVEYAIDKQALCDALGYGFYEPLFTISPQGDWGGDRQFRNYDPEKAKQLLAEAGYPDGLEITLLAQTQSSGRNDVAEAVKGYLDAVGFKVNLDIADTGRYSAAIYADGFEDLALAMSGNDQDYLVSAQRWWGPQPRLDLQGYECTPELAAIFEKSLKTNDRNEQKKLTEEIVYYIAEEALVIPLYNNPTSVIHNGKVHTTYLQQGLTRFDYANTWLEK